MRSSYKIHDKSELYFITSTIIEWVPVFTGEKYFNILIDTIKFSQKGKNLKLYAYVIMDNHFHAFVQSEDLTNIMKSIKGYTAREIIKTLKSDKKEWLLNQLGYYKLKHKIKSKYQLWQESFHPQQIITDRMLQQKS